MVLAIVPAAPPTRKNQRTTSWPAPISAKVPYQRGSRLIRSAFCSVSAPSSSCDITITTVSVRARDRPAGPIIACPGVG